MDLETKRQRIQEFAKARMDFDPTGHDFWHANRVSQLAQKLYIADFGNDNVDALMIIEAAAYLHDTIDDKLVSDIIFSQMEVEKLIEELEFSTEARENIMFTIQHMSYSKNLTNQYDLSIEGQYVQDADRIDALGAIGIARTFAYGGHANNEIYNPNIPIIDLKSKEDYRNHPTTAINHFHEKLLKLELTMNTEAGTKIAHERTEFMRQFLAEFMAEWQGEI
ncbi:MAG: phosphohydrolase [Aerococcus viridans]|nr:MAG: phosphohydrolase [Aerococcus viridans]